MRKTLSLFMSLLLVVGLAHSAVSQTVASKVIFDTDIGDDIDDAYALGLPYKGPRQHVLGVTTAK